MTVNELATACGWKNMVKVEGSNREVSGCYIGDLLSWVMARAQSGNVWLTVIGNINSIAVAALADVSAIVLTENATLDSDAAQRAEMQGIPVFGCAENLYDTAIRVYEMLK